MFEFTKLLETTMVIYNYTECIKYTRARTTCTTLFDFSLKNKGIRRINQSRESLTYIRNDISRKNNINFGNIIIILFCECLRGLNFGGESSASLSRGKYLRGSSHENVLFDPATRGILQQSFASVCPFEGGWFSQVRTYITFINPNKNYL